MHSHEENSHLVEPEDISRFLSGDYLLNTGKSMLSSDHIHSKHDFNWLNLSDYLSNLDKLSYTDRSALTKLLKSDTLTNSNRYGIKRKNLESHLLLSIGADIDNILSCGKSLVETNLKTLAGKYSRLCASNRTLDPKTSHRAYQKFSKTYSVETLFKTMSCYQAVVVRTATHSSDPREMKESFHKFFKENVDRFSQLANKSKKIKSYLYSNEISVDSILSQTYRPHTHLVFWIPKLKNPEQEQLEVEAIERDYNSRFSDRSFKLLRIEKDSREVPYRVTSYSKIKTSINYLFRSYSLAENYLREISRENIRELNIKTKETLHNLVYFFQKKIR